MIVTGTHVWILGEEIIEEDKWDNCPICRGEKNDDNISSLVPKQK